MEKYTKHYQSIVNCFKNKGINSFFFTIFLQNIIMETMQGYYIGIKLKTQKIKVLGLKFSLLLNNLDKH